MSIKTKTPPYKGVLVGVGIISVLLVGLIFACNFIFNPLSSVHFTVYVPPQKSISSSHLVIPGYEQNFITIFGMQQAVFGYAILGENIKVIQEQSTTEVNCNGLEKCATKWTKNGQLYKYGYKKYNESDEFEQVVLFKKGHIKITVRKAHNEAWKNEELDKFIDTLEPGSIGQPYVYGEHRWQLI